VDVIAGVCIECVMFACVMFAFVLLCESTTNPSVSRMCVPTGISACACWFSC